MSGVYTPSAWDFGHDPEECYKAPVRRPKQKLAFAVVPEPRRGAVVFSDDKRDHNPLKFGKFRGKSPCEIAALDADYLLWIKDNHKDADKLVSPELLTQCLP